MMADEADVVDINRATVKDLETLFGIGRAKAEAIYTARMVKGTFTSLEELLTVPGIGRNVLEQNKDILVCEAVLDPVMEEAEDSLFHQEDGFRGDHTNRHHNRTSVDNGGVVNGQAIDGIEASYGTPPQVSSQTPPITNKPLPHTRRSSRRSSYHLDPVAATTSSSSASVSSITTPASTGVRNTTTRISAHLAGKYLAAASSKAASTHCRTNSLHSIALYPGYSSSTITRNRQTLEPHFSSINLGANKNSNHDTPNLNEDSAMEWIDDRETSENNLDVNRLNKPEGSSNGDIDILNKRKFAINGSSCSGYLIADELGEAELNKLRVGENNYGEDNGENPDLLYKDDSSVDDIDDSMHETSEEIAAALRQTARTAALPGNVGPSAVPGSDTPYEEPSEAQVMQVGSLSPSAADMDRLRAIYAAPSSAEDTSRSQSQSDVHDLSAAPSNNIMVINMSSRSTSSGSINGLSSQSVSRQRKSSDSNSNNDFDHLTFSSVGSVIHSHPSTSRDSSNSSKCNVLAASGSYVQSIESLDSSLTHSEDSIVCVPDDDSPQSDDDDVDEDTDEELQEGADEDEHEQMVVESPILLSDKKQGKRKYEVAGELRALLPVKKSCKAEELSPSGSVCSTSSVRRIAPIPTGLPSWLLQFSGWSPQEKLTALDHLIDVCDLNQVRHVHHIILPTFQRDFISLLPKELALYVLSYLTPKDLLKAAQTCKYWNVLTADNLLWREKCKEAGIDNFIDHMDKRRKKGTCVSSVSPYKTMFMRRHTIECNWRVNPLKEHRILKGHDDHVITCLQFSGNTIVSGSDDNTLKVWNATTSKCLRTLIGHTGGVWSSQMRDNIIVSGSTDRMLRVWDADTGLCKQTLYGHTSTVRCLHLHNNIVVSGSRDATLRVWDVTTGTCHHVLVGHVAAVRCVQYNGRLVVSGAYDFMVKVWNPDTEECLHTLQGHTNRVYSLQFDGIHVVSGSLDTTIRVWNVESGTCKHILMGHQSLTSGMELHNNILISGNADSTVKVWDILTGQCLQTLSGPNKHRSAVTCLQFINKFVVTSSDDGTVKLWDVSTGEFVRNLVTLDTGNSGGVVWRIRASDTKLVCAVGSRNGTEETKLLVLDFDVEET